MKCLVLMLLMVNLVLAKQYERCELAKELNDKHNVTLKEIGMLVCFAEIRSNLDTESLDNGNYGLLKVNFHFIDIIYKLIKTLFSYLVQQ